MGHDITRLQFTTPVQAQPRYWANGKVKHNHPNAHHINSTIDALAERAVQLHAQYINDGAFPVPQDFIKQILSAHIEAPLIAPPFFTDYDLYISYLQDRRISGKYTQKQIFLKKLLLKFQAQTQYTLSYQTINRTFAAKFAAWCADNLPKRRNNQDTAKTAERYILDLKHFLNHAHREGWANDNPWRAIQIKKTAPKFPVTVNADEIAQLWAITPDNIAHLRADLRTGLLITRDWFIFATQTAIRWSDWQSGRIRIITLVPDRVINIQITTEKTDAPLEIPLTALAIAVLQRNNMRLPEGYPFNTTTRHLRTLAHIAGIKKKITTHTARRTFCTQQEAAGVPRAYIMRITGHKREDDYLRYTGITFALNADLMRRANPAVFKTAG